MKKVIIAVSVTAVLVAALIFASFAYFIPLYHYNSAVSLSQEGDYDNAYRHFMKCAGFKDTNELLEDYLVVCDRMITYDESGDILSKNVYEYDDCGRELCSIRYDEHDLIEWGQKSEYDEKGNLTLFIDLAPDGGIDRKDVYRYDERGNEVLYTCYDRDGNMLEKIEYEYDDRGNQTLSVWYVDPSSIKISSQF